VPADVLEIAEEYVAGSAKRKSDKEKQSARKKQRLEGQQKLTSHYKVKKLTPSEEADLAAVELVAAGGTSFSLLENVAFIAFVAKAVEAGPGYKPPTRQVGTHSLL
jgi:hypothetical protein